MARVRTTCPDCGDVEIDTEIVKVRLCVEDNSGTYAFRCPVCARATVRPADPRVVNVLVSSGVPLTMWRLPAELSEPRSGSPITHDELLAFHQLLESDVWFSKVAAMVER